MGYTHYFEVVGNAPTDEEWEQICQETNRVFNKYSDVLCEESDEPENPPIANLENIFFNGVGDDGHETFVVSRDMKGFNFCKTAEKPYDAAVVEVLKIVKSVCPNWLRLSSDGDDSRTGFKLFG